jgi:hypothetical protein
MNNASVFNQLPFVILLSWQEHGQYKYELEFVCSKYRLKRNCHDKALSLPISDVGGVFIYKSKYE